MSGPAPQPAAAKKSERIDSAKIRFMGVSLRVRPPQSTRHADARSTTRAEMRVRRLPARLQLRSGLLGRLLAGQRGELGVVELFHRRALLDELVRLGQLGVDHLLE